MQKKVKMKMIEFFEKHTKLSFFIVLLIAIAIFYISSLPAKAAPTIGLGFETILYHLVAFFFLAAFLLFSVIKGKNKNLFFIPISIALVYGVLDEFHQLFVQGRTSSFSDFLLDSTGILFAGFIYVLFLSRKK